MGLSGQQRKQLRDALISAFPDKDKLKQMLFYELEKQLDTIAIGNDLQDIVSRLIETAETENWVKDLIDAAHKSNPGNPSLRAITVFYINEEIRAIESITENIPTTGDKASAVGADYTKLADMLNDRDFQAANEETTRIMCWVARRDTEGYLRARDIENFPCRDLLTIDQLWLASSGGKYGFSVQKQIWIDVGGKLSNNLDNLSASEEVRITCAKFIRKVEWGNTTSMQWDLRGIKGHLPFFGSWVWGNQKIEDGDIHAEIKRIESEEEELRRGERGKVKEEVKKRIKEEYNNLMNVFENRDDVDVIDATQDFYERISGVLMSARSSTSFIDALSHDVKREELSLLTEEFRAIAVEQKHTEEVYWERWKRIQEASSLRNSRNIDMSEDFLLDDNDELRDLLLLDSKRLGQRLVHLEFTVALWRLWRLALVRLLEQDCLVCRL